MIGQNEPSMLQAPGNSMQTTKGSGERGKINDIDQTIKAYVNAKLTFDMMQ